MAAKLADVVEEIKGVLRSPIPAWQQADKVLDLSCGFLLRALARDPEKGKVAVLMVVREHDQLTFIYPRHLARGNVLPIATDSFAGRVVLERAVLIENSVPEEPHKDFFERIPGPEGMVLPIQKMIAAPLVDGSEAVVGVIEVSRVGRTPAEAGEDFTATDGQNLAKCCRVFSPFIVRAWSQVRAG